MRDYSDYVVNRRISVAGTNNASRKNKKLTFNNNAPFRSCISKINKTFNNNAEDPNIVMSIYNLLKHSDNYPMTPGSLWNYYRDDDANEK